MLTIGETSKARTTDLPTFYLPDSRKYEICIWIVSRCVRDVVGICIGIHAIQVQVQVQVLYFPKEYKWSYTFQKHI